jgi:ribosome-binding factor A
MRRPERVAELLREELVEIVGFELSDPRVEAVTVTDVRVADDLRDARVYVLIEGDEAEIKVALKALQHAAPYVRQQVGLSLNLRHAPHLYFVRDTVEEQAARIESVLQELMPLEKETQERLADGE